MDNRIKISIDGEDPFIIDDNFEKIIRQLLVELEDLSNAQ